MQEASGSYPPGMLRNLVKSGILSIARKYMKRIDILIEIKGSNKLIIKQYNTYPVEYKHLSDMNY